MKKILYLATYVFTTCIQAQQPKEAVPQYRAVEQQLRNSHQLIANEPFAYFDTSLKKAMLYDPKTGTLSPLHQSIANKSTSQRPTIQGSTASNNFALVKDINPAKDANPFNYSFSYNSSSFAVLNNVSYYAADNGINGSELWRSDGTAAGTYMVKDINAGEASSNVFDVIVSNNRLFFIAYTPFDGNAIWTSDGTESGTVLLKNVNSSGGYNPERLTDVDGKVYFVTGNYFSESQLWISDGTTGGTQIVSDLKYNGVNTVNLNQLTAANGLLFFTAYSSATGNELYRSDGTAAGTYMVKDINNVINDYFDGPAQLTYYKNKLYFSANDGTGRILWSSDGTYANTNPAPGNNNVLLQSGYYYASLPFTISNQKLFFPGFTSASGWELFKYDGSAPGAVVVKNVTPGSGNTNLFASQIVAVGNTVYFTFGDSAGIIHLWKSNGKSAGTDEVVNLGQTNYYNLFDAGNQLLFNVRTDSTGYELWRSDGTAAGTKLIKDIYSGEISSNPSYNTNCNGVVLFGANSAATGRELWKTDGTAAGTMLVKDANKTSTSGSNPNQIIAFKNSVFFTAYKFEKGNELWKSNGTPAGTSLVKDITPGENSGYPNYFTTKNNFVYFTYNSYPGNNLYRTDGTAQGTKGLFFVNSNPIQSYIVTDNGNIFYYGYDYVTGSNQLWKSDGSANGNIQLKSGLAISNVYYNYPAGGSFIGLVSIGNSIYFSATDNPNNDGYELWKSDGTPAGTSRVKDIVPGTVGSNPTNLVVYNGALYFSAFDGTRTALYKSDGTAAGTVKVYNVLPSNFCVSNNLLFFSGYDYTTNQSELWKTDGTKKGTKIVKDINQGINSSSPYNLIDVDGLLYFTATDDSHGTELWTSDGSSKNTKLTKDATPGFSSTYISSLTGSSGKLFFVKDNILWISDGTDAGTHIVDDAGLADITYIQALKSTGDKLFLEGYTYRYGYELYAGNTSTLSFARSGIVTKGAPVEALNASLVNNPVQDQMEIKINIKDDQTAQITITDIAGRKMTARNLYLSSGTNRFNYNTSSWQHGMYVVKIVYADGSTATLKAIK